MRVNIGARVKRARRRGRMWVGDGEVDFRAVPPVQMIVVSSCRPARTGDRARATMLFTPLPSTKGNGQLYIYSGQFKSKKVQLTNVVNLVNQ